MCTGRVAPQHVLAKGKVKQRPVTRSPVPLPHCCPIQHLSQQGPQVRRQLYPNTGQKIFKRGHRCHNPGAPSPGLTLLTLRRAGVWMSVPVRGQWDERRRNRDTPVPPPYAHRGITDKTWVASLKKFHHQNSQL